MYRLVNAAHLLAYVGLGDAYNEENLFDPFNNLYRLLTKDEVERVKQINLGGGNAYREVIAWAMSSLKQESIDGTLTNKQMKAFSAQLLNMRGQLARLFHYTDLPVPFSYVHAINFQTFLFLPLYAHSLAYSYNRNYSSGKPFPAVLVLSDSMIQSLYLFWYILAMLSLRTLAQRLQDPFGHNLEDLSVLQFVRMGIIGSSKLMCAPAFQHTSEHAEASLFDARDALGKTFEFYSKTLVTEGTTLVTAETLEMRCIDLEGDESFNPLQEEKIFITLENEFNAR